MVVKHKPFLQIQSQHDLKHKFQPEWLSRTMVYEEAAEEYLDTLLKTSAERLAAAK